MLTGRSQTPHAESAEIGDFRGAQNWVAKHAQAVWRLLLTILTRGYYSSCAGKTKSNGVDSDFTAARKVRRQEWPEPCHMRPCPTRKDAALRQLCRGGRPKTCQIRTEGVASEGDSARARASLLIWLQSAWSQARPILWMREGSPISEPDAAPTASLPRRNKGA